MVFLLTSFNLSMSNSEPLLPIFLVVNWKSSIGAVGLAMRQSSKLEFSRVIRYSSTDGTG